MSDVRAERSRQEGNEKNAVRRGQQGWGHNFVVHCTIWVCITRMNILQDEKRRNEAPRWCAYRLDGHVYAHTIDRYKYSEEIRIIEQVNG